MKILVVEDERWTIEGLICCLGKRKYQAMVTRSEKDAIQALQTDAYDAIILDIVLPIRSDPTVQQDIDAGLRILERLRNCRISAMKTAPTVPVLVCTARSRHALDSRLRGIEGVRVVEKPADPEFIVETLDNLMLEMQ